MSKSKKINSKSKESEKLEKINRMDSEKVEDMFSQAFRQKVDSNEDGIVVEEFDCSVEKDLTSSIIKIKVTIYGFAGNASRRNFHDKKSKKVAKSFKEININDVPFCLEDSFDLNTNDYVLIYSN